VNASHLVSRHTRARVAAGALFFDDAGPVMLVRPTYKDHLDIPGGYVEVGETPRQACEREVHEELGLRVDVDPLLLVDWAPHPDEGDKLLFVFDGGRLTGSQLDRIHLQPDELVAYSFYALDAFTDVLIPRLERRASSPRCR
jgi:8-oxo-dGTP pyrophosphatase MutT (NUDIX family)